VASLATLDALVTCGYWAYGWLGAVGPLYGLWGRGIERREEVERDLVVPTSDKANDCVFRCDIDVGSIGCGRAVASVEGLDVGGRSEAGIVRVGLAEGFSRSARERSIESWMDSTGVMLPIVLGDDRAKSSLKTFGLEVVEDCRVKGCGRVMIEPSPEGWDAIEAVQPPHPKMEVALGRPC
jgi:hypothetical protein